MTDQSPSEYSPLGILNKARNEFDKEVAHPASFITYRGLRKREIPILNGKIEKVEGYLDVLPTLEGKDFLQLVNDKIKERELARQSQEKVKVVDIGYGTGEFLFDCRKEWQDKVQIIGYGTDVYTKTIKLNSEVIIPWRDKRLEKADVELIQGNVVDIRKKLGDNFADIIVSSMALMYVHYPEWELVKKIYRVLRPGGIALLDYTPTSLEMFHSILEYLEDKGYSFEVNKGLAFQKTKQDINVPIRTINLNSLHSRLKISSTR
ncbi:MAG: hypothetical protein A3B47_00810 [Candidatus Levybacteria bacterium RIFCSPLOWO2_01_FULL_39_24]|nr:MAG: hypothetical protein A2800_02840 [Candidatus Levybacteria bacterium RIFCSPHIGHO2_01_FULL_40_16]OGH45921.1 MAG: hypothetical protein A3B47_00810 [Candidatus Levybacteria bacterium RIFCSPLOWO2_01_FULL_39_24]